MSTRKPNIVYVMADQLRRQSCGYAGDSRAITPTIDCLAEEGMSFENAVVSMPVCSAYRASLYTGKYTNLFECHECKQTKKVVSQLYESRVDDIEHRARRAVSSAYEDQADDLEERAVRAMRTALTEESDRIKEVIEHAIQIKKREVRLSLLVLVVASLLYLLLYWITR